MAQETLQATSFQIDGYEVQWPSNVNLVSGLADYVKNASVAQATKATQDGAGAVITSTYAKQTGTYSKLVAGAATKATQDGAGAVIATTYYKKTDTVTNATNATKATQDGQGSNIVDTYARKDGKGGTYAQMTVGSALQAAASSTASYAYNDSGNPPALLNTYLKGASASGKTLTFTRGNGTTFTVQTQDTAYNNATATTAGLMSAEDKIVMDRVKGPTHIYPENDFGGDFNNVNVTGFFTVHSIQSWNHRPVDTNAASHSLLSFKTNAGAVHLLFNQQNGAFYQRTYIGVSGSGGGAYWTGWTKVIGTAVGTVEM